MSAFEIHPTHGAAPTHPAPAAQPRLERSAHEFEASLMSELLKPMQSGLNDNEDGSEGALAGFASESLAKAISERGGFGIANRILHQLAPGAKQNPAPIGQGSRIG